MGDCVRKTISMNKEMAGLVERVADMRQISQADVVREAIREYMEKRSYIKGA